jgi:hypothetical protein
VFPESLGKIRCIAAKKKIKNKKIPLPKLPKQRTTKIWFQGILGVKTSCATEEV